MVVETHLVQFWSARIKSLAEEDFNIKQDEEFLLCWFCFSSKVFLEFKSIQKKRFQLCRLKYKNSNMYSNIPTADCTDFCSGNNLNHLTHMHQRGQGEISCTLPLNHFTAGKHMKRRVSKGRLGSFPLRNKKTAGKQNIKRKHKQQSVHR